MRIATIKSLLDGETRQYLYISSSSEIQHWLDEKQKQIKDHIVYLQKNFISVEKYDHYLRKGSPLNISICTSKITGTNPVLDVGNVVQELLRLFTKAINNDKVVVINENGGWCYLDPSLHEVLSLDDYGAPVLWNAHIVRCNRWLNLENDSELEPHTIDKLGKDSFNYITGLQYMSCVELYDALRNHVDVGGSGVYVYTTATNMIQLEEYCAVISDVKGINSVWFQINTDQKIPKNILDMLRHERISVCVDYV